MKKRERELHLPLLANRARNNLKLKVAISLSLEFMLRYLPFLDILPTIVHRSRRNKEFFDW